MGKVKYTTKVMRDSETGEPLTVEIDEKELDEIQKSAIECAEDQIKKFKEWDGRTNTTE